MHVGGGYVAPYQWKKVVKESLDRTKQKQKIDLYIDYQPLQIQGGNYIDTLCNLGHVRTTGGISCN